MVDPHMSFQVLFGGEADRGSITSYGTLIWPLVPVVVGFAILLLIIAHMKVIAQEAFALEKIRTIVIRYRIIEVSDITRDEVSLQ